MNVKMVKLITGEEVIADVEPEVKNMNVILHNPHILTVMPDPETGRQGLALVKWPMYCHAPELEICVTHTMFPPVEIENQDIVRAYVAKVGGILTPPQKSLIV